MRILGLTGSIGMGKSTAAVMLRQMGLPVHDADAVVHRLMGPGGAAVPRIAARWPGAVRNGAVDRQALGAAVLGDPAALRQLEAILHPLVRQAERRFLRQTARRRVPLAVLDIPLLLETGGDKRCDAVAVMWAPRFLQAQRVLRRPGMTAAKLAAIRAQQTSEPEKRARADFLVPTGLGRRATLRRLLAVVDAVKAGPARHWPPRPWARVQDAGVRRHA